MQAFRERCSSAIQGKFHSGFLQRALKFPMETILSNENFRNSSIVVCGHSLGGAIASIVGIRLQKEKVIERPSIFINLILYLYAFLNK